MPTLPLKDIPEDVRNHVLQVQTDMKIKKKISQFSQVAAIYHIIREHKKLTLPPSGNFKMGGKESPITL